MRSTSHCSLFRMLLKATMIVFFFFFCLVSFFVLAIHCKQLLAVCFLLRAFNQKRNQPVTNSSSDWYPLIIGTSMILKWLNQGFFFPHLKYYNCISASSKFVLHPSPTFFFSENPVWFWSREMLHGVKCFLFYSFTNGVIAANSKLIIVWALLLQVCYFRKGPPLFFLKRWLCYCVIKEHICSDPDFWL